GDAEKLSPHTGVAGSNERLVEYASEPSVALRTDPPPLKSVFPRNAPKGARKPVLLPVRSTRASRCIEPTFLVHALTEIRHACYLSLLASRLSHVVSASTPCASSSFRTSATSASAMH